MKGIFVDAQTSDAFHNLAIEEYLMRECADVGSPVLFLWKNGKAVIIGRNQNAYTECDLVYAKAHGIKIVRRMTGGGAVFHDEGNLNFSFILPKSIFDTARTMDIVISALRSTGVDASYTGRNDVTVKGKKVSGNAFYHNELIGLHHGTILHHVDLEMMSRVLTVSSAKIARHGVSSVKSRVENIVDNHPFIKMDEICNAIRNAFCDSFEIQTSENLCINEIDIKSIKKKYSSDEWNINRIQDFGEVYQKSFLWGNVTMSLEYEGEELRSVEIASDTLFADAIEKVKNELNHMIDGKEMKMENSFPSDQKQNDNDYERMRSDLKEMFMDAISGRDHSIS